MKLLNILLEDTRIETIAQKLVSAYNTYNGSNSVSIYPNSITDSRFEISSDGGKSGMGNSYFMVNLLGDVYLSDGVSSERWFNEKDSDQVIYRKVKKILDKSAAQVRTSDKPEEDTEWI